jgi:hypothetical protein
MAGILQISDDNLRYCIFPLLDWNSRVNFNSVLPNNYRISTKFDMTFINLHECYVISSLIRKKLVRLSQTDPNNYKLEITNLINLISALKKPRISDFIVKFPVLKEIVIKKCNDFSFFHNYNRRIPSRSCKKLINNSIKLCILAKKVLENKKTDSLNFRSKPFIPIKIV